VTLLPIVIDVKLVQLLNAEVPIFVTDVGRFEVAKLEHPRKQSLPISRTELGIITDVKFVQSWKALAPMYVTVLPPSEPGIITSPLIVAGLVVALPGPEPIPIAAAWLGEVPIIV